MPPADARPVVVCGLGRVGRRVADFLRTTGVPVAVIGTEADPADPRLAGMTVVRGDCRDHAALEAAGVRDARGVIVCTGNDLVNVAAALAVRRLNPDARVVVRMFNPTLVPRLGDAVRNTTALSVSALTAPLLAVSALTGESLGGFALDGGAMQVAEVAVDGGSELVGRPVADVAGQYHLLVVGLTSGDSARLFAGVRGDERLGVGDRLAVCGRPDDLDRLLAPAGDLLTGVYWAGWLRRHGRTAGRTLATVDRPVQIGTAALFLTILASTLVFRFGLGTGWADGLYQTVSAIGTATDLHGDQRPAWGKVFLSVLKLAGAALVAAFTAIFTQYLLRAKLGGAFEARRIPDAGHVVVCGLGNVGFRCVEELVRLGRPVVAVERDPAAPFAATVRRMGVPVLAGDGAVPAVLAQARAGAARAVIAATSSDLANIEIALLVRDINPAQRVVVRLADPDFAEAVRDVAGLQLAVSVPALAAPAFAAALYGDRVQTLVPVGGRTLAVVELNVQPADPCLGDVPLAVAMADYEFLPVAVAGKPPFAADGIPRGYRLQPGDRLTVILDLVKLDRLLRREPAPAGWAVVVDGIPILSAGALVPLVRSARGCSQAEAEGVVQAPPFTLAEGLTRGAAEELLGRAARERAAGRVVATAP